MGKILQKVTATITAIASIFTWTFSNGFAQEVSQIPAAISPAVLSIPQELGKISFSDQNALSVAPNHQNQKLIVHIRDAHGSYEAQSNIEKILTVLTQEFSIGQLFLEGAPANSKILPQLLHLFQDPELNLKIADEMMRVGELTGPEMFLIKNSVKNVISAHGVEDGKLYSENLRSYRQVMLRQDKTKKFIQKLNAQIEMIASKRFDKQLRDFVKTWSAWRNEQIDLVAYLMTLRKTVQRVTELDLGHAKNQETHPMLVRFFKAKEFELTIQIKFAIEEQAKFKQFISGKSMDSAIRTILSEWNPDSGLAGWNSKLLPRHVLEVMYSELEPLGFRFQNYPALSQAWGSLILQSELEAGGLFDEIDQVTALLFDRMAQTDEEKRLINFIHQSILLDQLFRLELTRENAAKMKSDTKALQPSHLYRAIRNIEHESDAKRADLNLSLLDKIFDSAVQFYDLAIAREEAILQNVNKQIKESGDSRAIIVSGGFHSDGFEKIFKDAGYSYLEITPRMTSVDQVSQIYRDSMLGSRKTIFDTAHLQHLLTLLSADARRVILGPVGRLDPVVESVTDAVLAKVADPTVLFEFNKSDFAREHSLGFRKVEDRLAREPYIQLAWTDPVGIAHEVISIPIKNGALVSSPIKAGVILDRQSPAASQLEAIQRVIGSRGLGTVEISDVETGTAESWFVEVDFWEHEHVAAPSPALTLPPARSELRSGELQLISQGPGMWIALGIGAIGFGWGFSLLRNSVFGKDVSFTDRLGGFVAGSGIFISSVIGVPIVIWLAVTASLAASAPKMSISPPEHQNIIPQLISPDSVQAPTQDRESETQVAPEVTFEDLIQSARNPDYKRFLERVYEVYRFLEWSESYANPNLPKRDQELRRASLLLGYLVIWQAENPTDLIAQIGGGPAIGPEQIELETARHVLSWTNIKAEHHPARMLLNAASEILELDLSPQGLRKINLAEELRKNRLLQLVVWRNLIDRKGMQPRGGDIWAHLHARFYNTSYLEDLKRLNRNQPIGYFNRGLAIGEKTKVIEFLIIKDLEDLAKIFSLSAQDAPRAVAQAEAKSRARWGEARELLNFYEKLTRILRVVRNADFDTNRNEKNRDSKTVKKVITELSALNIAGVRVELSKLSSIRVVSFSQAEWDSLIGDASNVIEEINQRRTAILDKAEGQNAKRTTVKPKPASKRQTYKRSRSELRTTHQIRDKHFKIVHRRIVQSAFKLAKTISKDPNESAYFSKIYLIERGRNDQYARLSTDSPLHWIGLQEYIPPIDDPEAIPSEIVNRLHSALRLGGFAVFAHSDKAVVEAVAKAADQTGFRVLPRQHSHPGETVYLQKAPWWGKNRYFVVLNKVKLRKNGDYVTNGYGVSAVEIVHFIDGREGVRKSMPPIRLIKERIIARSASFKSNAGLPIDDTVTMEDVGALADGEQARIALLLKREKALLFAIRQKLSEMGKGDILKSLPEFYDVSEGDHEIFMNFFRDASNPISLENFIEQSGAILDAIHQAGFVHGDPSHLNWVIGFGSQNLNKQALARLRDIYMKTGPIGRGLLRLDAYQLRDVRKKISNFDNLMSPWIDFLGYVVMLMQLSSNKNLSSLLLNYSEHDRGRLELAAAKALIKLGGSDELADNFKSVSEIGQFIIANMKADVHGSGRSELRSESDAVALAVGDPRKSPMTMRKLRAEFQKPTFKEHAQTNEVGKRAYLLLEELLKRENTADERRRDKFVSAGDLYRALEIYQNIANEFRQSAEPDQVKQPELRTGNELTTPWERDAISANLNRQISDMDLNHAKEVLAAIQRVFPEPENQILWSAADSRNEISSIIIVTQTILRVLIDGDVREEQKAQEVRSELREAVARISGLVALPGSFGLVREAIAAEEPVLTSPILRNGADPLLASVFSEFMQSFRNKFQRSNAAINQSVKPNQPRVALDANSSAAKMILRILPQIAALADEFGGAPKLEIHIANTTPEFHREYLRMRRESRLDAAGQAVLEKVLKFSSSSISTLTREPGTRNSGVFSEDESVVEMVHEKTYVTLADLSVLKSDDEIVQFLIPFLMLTGILGREISNLKSASEIESLLNSAAIQALLSEYGIQVTLKNGRFVGTISYEMLERLITQLRALEEIKQSA